jgi:16S rRNA (uracil1498-N3)-methyltransferase
MVSTCVRRGKHRARPTPSDTIFGVLRRVHTPKLYVGRIELDPAGSRHARDVLRLAVGVEVEAFDDAGGVARGTIASLEPAVVVQVDSINAWDDPNVTRITVAAAVPKGDRADWMVEKLSELGVARFVPLATARSVVLPEGRNKRDRWIRIATESAKQSRRRGVMQIEELMKLDSAMTQAATRSFVLSTDAAAIPILEPMRDAPRAVTLFIGPEGGWTDEELALLRRHDVVPVKLTDTVLRVETAAIVAAGVVATALASNPQRNI